MKRSILYSERRIIMENEKMLEDENRDMSWKEFKERYLFKIEYLAEILKLDRARLIKKVKDGHNKRDFKCKAIDDDYTFVEGVMDSIIDAKGNWEEQPLLYKLKNTDAEAIFDEVYRVWVFRPPLDNELYFEKTPRCLEKRSEVGKGDIVEIFTAYRESNRTYMSGYTGEDSVDSMTDIVVKVKHKSCLSNDELAKALRDLADAIDEKFENCLFSPYHHQFILPDNKEFQAILCGIYQNDSKLWYRVKTTPGYKVHTSIRDAGWINPDIPLENGFGVMLQKGWPELYERVLENELSPFEALLETGHVHPLDMYEVCGNGWDTEELLKGKWPRIYESVIAGKISHFEALMKTDLINWNHVEESSDNSDDRGDIEKVLKNGDPELYEKFLQNEISVFRALLEADLIDSRALYRTIDFNEKIEDVNEVQVEEIEESGEQLLQELEEL